MAHMRYANAVVAQAGVSGRGWSKVRTAAAAPNRNIMAQASEILGANLDPDKFLLTHSTIVASVDVEPVPGVRLGKVKVGSRTINRKYSDYYIKAECNSLINNNADAWSRDVLLASYQTFIGGHNFCFAPDTKVMMADGSYRPIEDIEAGDRVVTHKGRVRAVTCKFERDYEGDVQAVYVDRYKTPIVATGNHPFSAITVEAPPLGSYRRGTEASAVRYHQDQVVSALRGEANVFGGRLPRVRALVESLSNGPKTAQQLAEALGVRSVYNTLKRYPEYFQKDGSTQVQGAKRRIKAALWGATLEAKDFTSHTFNAKQSWVNADNIHTGTFLLGAERVVGKAQTPEAGRLLGYYLAEGCPLSPHRAYGVVLSFGPHETNLAEDARRCCKMVFPEARTTIKTTQTTTRVEMRAEGLHDWFVQNGGHLAPQKRLSEDVFSWAPEALLQVLGGWLAGDGDFHTGTLRLRGTTTSETLAWQMHRVAELCGIKTSVTFCKQSIGEVQSQVSLVVGGKPQIFDVIPRHHLWTLTVSKDSVNTVAMTTPRWARPVVVDTSKKRANFAWWDNHRVHTVSKNEVLPYKGKVYNIEVEEDHSYVVNYGVAVHNCEHVQIEEQSKGRIIDAVARDIGHSLYIDILVATSRAHTQLIKDIESAKMATLSMGCFLPGTMVTMADGTRAPIEDVQVGDMVLTHKGRSREVLNKQIRGVENGSWNIRRIRAQGVPAEIPATDIHPFFVYRAAEICACGCGEDLPKYAPPKGGLKHKYTTRKMTRRFKVGHDKRILNPNGSYSLEEYRGRADRLESIKAPKMEEVKAADLKVGDFLCFPRAEVAEVGGGATTGLARLLGYFLAEGSFLKYKGDPTEVQFNFSMGEKDTYVAEVVELLRREFPEANNPWVQERPERDTCVVHMSGRAVAAWFFQHGGEYSHRKRMSAEAMAWPVEMHKHVIGAWINGDGCLHSIHGNTSGTTTSYDLACQMHMLMARCGVYVRMECNIAGRSVDVRQVINGGVVVRDEATGKLPAFTLVAGQVDAQPLTGYSSKVIADPTFDNREFRVLDDVVMFPITSIKDDTYTGWVHDMEVEEDHSYVVEGVAVHNCSVEETICTKCGNVAIDETDLCPCIRYEKLNKFIDSAGQSRVVAELCFPSGIRVTLGDGSRTAIDDIQVGDMVLSHTGNRQEVVKTFERDYEGDLVGLNLVGVPQTLRSTPNHPYWVISQNGTCACGCQTPLKSVRKRFDRGEYFRKYAPGHNPTNVVSLEPPTFDFKEAGDIQVGDMVAMPVPERVITPDDVDEARARLLGWFLAEGSYLKKQGKRIGLQFTLNAEDEVGVAKMLAGILSEAFPPEIQRNKEFRFHVLGLLSDTPATAHQIVERTGAKPPMVLAAFKRLRDLGLVSSRRLASDEKAMFGASSTNTLLWTQIKDPDLRDWYSQPRVHLYDRTTEDGQKLVVNYVHRAASKWFFKHSGEYAGEKRLSPDAIFWPKNLQAPMLQAYLRGDGTVDSQMRHSVTSVSETLISQMQVVAARCGFWTRRQVVFEGRCVEMAAVVNGSPTPVGTDGFRPRHELHIQPSEEATAFFSMVGNPPQRGLAPAWRTHQGCMLYRVRDVWSEAYSGKVYNIKVEEDHSYLVEGVAVHNCGHPDIEDNAGVHFIEASWVATPAFEGAVLRNILDLDHMDVANRQRVQAALGQLPPQWNGAQRVKAAAYHAGFQFGDQDEEESNEAPTEEDKPDPLDEAVDRVEKTIREKAIKRVQDQIKKEDVEDALNSTESTMAPNDTVIKEGYSGAVKALVKKASSNVEFVDGFAAVNRVFGVSVPRRIYRASLQVGSVDLYPSMTRFLGACHHAAGGRVSPAEIRVMVRIGKLLSRLGSNHIRKEFRNG